MSKEHFHYCVMNEHYDIVLESSELNEDNSLESFVSSLKENLELMGLEDCLLCIEHTGIYSSPLIRKWLFHGGQLSVVAATKISSLLAGDHGWDEKSDWQDARRIAEYCIRFKDKLVPFELSKGSIEQLQALHRLRERMLVMLHGLKVPAQEGERFMSPHLSQLVTQSQACTISAMESDLASMDQKMQEIIDSDEELAQLFKLILSVEGVGKITARELLIATQAFTKFRPDEAKSFARYTGVAPRQWMSGKSVKRRSPHAKRSNQKVKALLTMGARSVGRTDGELGQYCRRKLAEGKPYMSVINALRNKIILRVFAVVRNQVTYQKNLNICLD